jgi:hypothetical protein
VADVATRPGSRTAPALRGAQVLAVLTVLELLWQFATAGQMVGPLRSRGPTNCTPWARSCSTSSPGC